MDQTAITVMNWMFFPLLISATILLVWKAISEKRKRKNPSAELITGALLVSAALIGVAELNIDRPGWLRWTLAAAQLIVLVILFKRTWLPLKHKLRGETD
jgi:hypothetical protein